ncbi:MAG: hypothetical protein JXQ75_02520, partial [Phycisphaerae bacterium]|nr:hypothetical protein [Phycisphaerae bacterium]
TGIMPCCVGVFANALRAVRFDSTPERLDQDRPGGATEAGPRERRARGYNRGPPSEGIPEGAA